MDWLAHLATMVDYYRWKRENHPDYPDVLLEWGLFHQLRGNLLLDAEGDEDQRREAESSLGAAHQALVALRDKGVNFSDLGLWSEWCQAPDSQPGVPPPDAGVLEQRLRDELGVEAGDLGRALLARIGPLMGQPDPVLQAAACPAFSRLFAAMAEFFAVRQAKDLAETLYAWAVLTSHRPERHWLYQAELERLCGDLGAVEILLATGLSRYPDSVALRREMARELDRQDRIPEAIALLEEAVAREPGWPDLRYELARLYERSEVPERSLEEFGKALGINPVYERAALSQAEALLNLGELEGAEERLMALRRQGVHPQRVYQLLSRIFAERADPGHAGRFGALAQRGPSPEDSTP
jgi:tetratricopeptide (TPR) repeat protein